MNLQNWTPRERPAPYTLAGQYSQLELLDWSHHGSGLFAAVGGDANADLWTYMPVGPFSDESQFEREFQAIRESRDWVTLVIRSAATQNILGMASYMRIRPEHGSVEVGCVTFGPDLKRTREATDAMFLMAQYAFDNLGYRRYEWKCNDANQASKRAALRLGFSVEGIFRNDMVVRGVSRDTAWYSITDEEWPTVNHALQAWLAPANFDPDGNQRLSLAAIREREAVAK
ncbi:MAG: GNAT family protein [Pseudomonadota bacterium]